MKKKRYGVPKSLGLFSLCFLPTTRFFCEFQSIRYYTAASSEGVGKSLINHWKRFYSRFVARIKTLHSGGKTITLSLFRGGQCLFVRLLLFILFFVFFFILYIAVREPAVVVGFHAASVRGV